MKFNWNYYITRLLSQSDSKGLKEDANTIISEFDLLEGQMIEALRDPSTLEYGLWLSDRNVGSLFEYSTYFNSLRKETIVEESVGMEICNNVFEIKENKVEFYKVSGDNLIKVIIQKIDGKYKVIEKIYQNINSLFGLIFTRYSEVENNFSYYENEVKQKLKKIGYGRLFTISVKIIDTIISTIKLLPDKIDIKEYTSTDNVYSDIKEDIYYNIESLNSKVKRK